MSRYYLLVLTSINALNAYTSRQVTLCNLSISFRLRGRNIIYLSHIVNLHKRGRMQAVFDLPTTRDHKRFQRGMTAYALSCSANWISVFGIIWAFVNWKLWWRNHLMVWYKTFYSKKKINIVVIVPTYIYIIYLRKKIT